MKRKMSVYEGMLDMDTHACAARTLGQVGVCDHFRVHNHLAQDCSQLLPQAHHLCDEDRLSDGWGTNKMGRER